MTISSSQAAEFLAAHDQYLILTHVRPDGDTVGCAAALCRALRALGKSAHVLPNPELTPLFAPIWRASWPRKIFFRHGGLCGHRRPEPVPGQCPCPISPG